MDHRAPSPVNLRHAPQGRSTGCDMVGITLLNYRVTARVKSPNHSAAFELTCVECGATRRVQGANIRAVLNGRRSIAACECVDPIFGREQTLEEFEINPTQLEALIAVLAHEVAYPDRPGPLRSAVIAITGSSFETAVLVKKGYVETAGNPARLTATPKAWRRTGFQRPERAQAAE